MVCAIEYGNIVRGRKNNSVVTGPTKWVKLPVLVYTSIPRESRTAES
jgi:hypothetical protein